MKVFLYRVVLGIGKWIQLQWIKPFVFCWIHTNLIIGKFNCRIFCSTRFRRVHRGGGCEFYNLVKRQNVVWHFHSQKSLTPIQRRHDASAQMFFEEVLLYLFGGSLFSKKNLNHILFQFSGKIFIYVQLRNPTNCCECSFPWVSNQFQSNTLSSRVRHFLGASKTEH